MNYTLRRSCTQGWLLLLPLAAGVATALAADPSDSESTHAIDSAEHGAVTVRHQVVTRAVYHPSAKPKRDAMPPGLVLTSRESPRPVIMYQASAPHSGEILYLNDSPEPVVQHPMNVSLNMAPTAPRPTPSTEIRRATIVNDDEPNSATPPRAEIVGPPDPPAAITPPPAPRPARKLLDVTKLPIAQPSKHSWYRVVSPFPPYHELDVTGLSAGSLARDPACGKIFRLP